MSHNETATVIATAKPHELLDEFVNHVETDHDVSFETSDNGYRYIENAGFRVAMRAQDDGLRIVLNGANSGMLIFIKDAISQHVAHIDPALAQNLRWSGETARQGELPENFRILRMLGKGEPLPGMVRVTLDVPDEGLFDDAGLHLKMMLPSVPGRKPVWPTMAPNGAPVWPEGEDALHARFLTIRAARPNERQIDLDVVGHGDGLISNWAMSAQPGDEIGAMGPTGPSDLPDAEQVFLAADGTGLPLLARIIEILPDNTRGHLIGEADSLEGLLNYLPETRLTVSNISPGEFPRQIVDHTNDVARPGEVDFALFAGEFDNAQALRKIFKQTLKLGKREQLSMAYWRRGEIGFES